MKFKAMAAQTPKGKLSAIDVEPGPLGDDQVEIAVSHCGICHSDLSMLNNDWGMSSYPLVPGHEAVGEIVAIGSKVLGRKAGQKVGLGWYSGSCLSCRVCMGGDHNLCARNESTMIGRYGGFADRVRCQWAWATPIPEGVDVAKAGPLFCGGITVFNPIVQFSVKPTDRVGVVGIGGLGHLAVQFLNKWGCEVTAFTSTMAKAAEARALGAHHVIASTDVKALGRVKGRFDLIMVTANVTLPWAAYVDALGPRGKLHFVGAVLEPVPVGAFSLIMQQRAVSGSPLGSPATTETMLDFCARHTINAVTETFPMSKANEALEHLHAGKARYRVVLAN
jgi:alcohol/geraniol dehydrogenase (NADP+)